MSLPTEILLAIEDRCDMDTKIRLRRAMGWKPERINVKPFEDLFDSIPEPDYEQAQVLGFSGNWYPRLEITVRFSNGSSLEYSFNPETCSNDDTYYHIDKDGQSTYYYRSDLPLPCIL